MRRKKLKAKAAVTLAAVLVSAVCILWGCGPTSPGTNKKNESESSVSESPDYEKAELVLSMGCSGLNNRQDVVEAIWERSGEEIFINIYSDGIIGSDEEILQSVGNGTVSIYSGSTSGLTSLVPEVSLLDIPYLFDGLEECNDALKDKLINWFQPYFHQRGYQLLGWGSAGFRELTCNANLKTPEDFKKLKLRIMNNPYHARYWEALGAEVRHMDYSEVFYALQQGTINAQDNPVTVAVSTNVSSVQDYFALTDHLPFVLCYVMNKEEYDAMDPEQQDVLQYCMMENLMNRSQVNQEEDRKAAAEVMEEIVLTPEIKAFMKEKNQVVIKELKKNLGEDLVGEFLEMVGEPS